MTDEIKGKPISEVAAIRADDLLDLLGIDISPARLKCAMLSHDSLQHVLADLSDHAATDHAATDHAAADPTNAGAADRAADPTNATPSPTETGA